MHHCGYLPDGTVHKDPNHANLPDDIAYTAEFSTPACTGVPLKNMPRHDCSSEQHDHGAGGSRDQISNFVHLKAHESQPTTISSLMKESYWSSSLVSSELVGKEIFRTGNPFHLTVVPAALQSGVVLRIPQVTLSNTEFRVEVKNTSHIYVLYEDQAGLAQWKTEMESGGFVQIAETASFARWHADGTATTANEPSRIGVMHVYHQEVGSESRTILPRTSNDGTISFVVKLGQNCHSSCLAKPTSCADFPIFFAAPEDCAENGAYSAQPNCGCARTCTNMYLKENTLRELPCCRDGSPWTATSNCYD